MQDPHGLKVWVVGPHSAGKTKIAEDLSKLYNLPLIRETARQELHHLEHQEERRIDFRRFRADIPKYDVYEWAVFRRQVAAEAAHAGGFVSDRAALDAIVYAHMWCGVGADIEDSDEYKSYVQQFPKLTDKVFDPRAIVLFVAPEVSLLEDDGIREPPSMSDVHEYYGAMELFLSRYRIRHVPITTPHHRKRLAAAREVIDRALMIPRSTP